MASSSPSYEKYLHPVEVNVRDFVPINLSNRNYTAWKTLMLCLIESRGMIDFINGKVSAPTERITVPDDSSIDGMKEIENPDYREWKKSDELLQSWIVGTIDVRHNVRPDVECLKTAKDMWERLTILLEPNYLAYPYPIEVNVGDFVPFKLSSSNYDMWQKMMLRLFENEDLLGFILSGHNMYVPRAYYLAWKRTDALVQSWIIRTINEDLLALVVDSKTARDMWKQLEESFRTVIKDYPYPVEVNVEDFVPIRLSTENYSLWRKLMLRLINAQGLGGFIRGEVPAPPKWVKNYKTWESTDQLLQSWILGTINQEDVLGWLVELETAPDIWTKLEKKFIKDRNYERSESERNRKHLNMYRPLHNATLDGDWNKAKEFFLEGKEDAVSADITGEGDTILMVAVRSEKRNHFVKNLLEFMSQDQVTRAVNHRDQTSLHIAAAAGNLEAAKLLVDKNPHLPNISDKDNGLPLHQAALYGHRNMVLYLLQNTKLDFEGDIEGDTKLVNFLVDLGLYSKGHSGFTLIQYLVISGLYDIALQLIKSYLAKIPTEDDVSDVSVLLRTIAMENSAFRSGTIFNLWQWLIYFCIRIRVQESTYSPSGGDIYGTMKQKLLCLFWTIVPAIKRIREAKCKHYHAVELFKYICLKLAESESPKVEDAIKTSLTAAITSGIPEIVKVIISVFPEAIYLKNEENQNLFHIAILNRQKKIFKLICQFTDKLNVRTLLSMPNSLDKTGLDMAARLTSEQKLKLKTNAVGAALQMQLELQWFQEIEKLSFYHENKWKIGKKTPATTFSETHKDLMKEGEKWLKDTANSCTIVAALIVTIVFAAAITVPGGNDGNSGHPILAKDIAFKIFIISDALALFSSVLSLLMFLFILTSRYAEIDFLFALPRRLITGLVTIFISIVSMMVAFVATLSLVFGENRAWFFAPASVISAVTVILFASWQFPLLGDMIKSTIVEAF